MSQGWTPEQLAAIQRGSEIARMDRTEVITALCDAEDVIDTQKVELATVRAQNEKLREQRDDLIKRDSLGMALSDMTAEEMKNALDAEVAALEVKNER